MNECALNTTDQTLIQFFLAFSAATLYFQCTPHESPDGGSGDDGVSLRRILTALMGMRSRRRRRRRSPPQLYFTHSINIVPEVVKYSDIGNTKPASKQSSATACSMCLFRQDNSHLLSSNQGLHRIAPPVILLPFFWKMSLSPIRKNSEAVVGLEWNWKSVKRSNVLRQSWVPLDHS